VLATSVGDDGERGATEALDLEDPSVALLDRLRRRMDPRATEKEPAAWTSPSDGLFEIPGQSGSADTR
jgi:hypothetical protein